MADSLFSESWYRVSDLKPRLRSHAQIHHHTYRGRDWYVLQDHSTGSFHRFSQEAYHIIGLMDGNRTLNQIWETACRNLGDDMPTQDEVIRLLSQLHQVDVLQTDIPPDIADLHQRYMRKKRSEFWGKLRSPLSVRFPLFDPERFLSVTHFLVRPLLGWAGLLIYLFFTVSAFFFIVIHWPELTSNLTDRVLALENVFLLWLAYPIVKVMHEFGHAYTVRHWGGEVHEMGIMFLVFVPIPYLDASSSSAFKEKYKRVMVGAAGIITETFIASIAMWVWLNVEPGPVRALAFNVMIIAGVSTILFNGNPLIRFDAYYVLSDLIEIPNLAIRSNRYIGYLFQRYIFKIEEAQTPVTAKGEPPWLLFYGIASFAYRMFIMVRIAIFVAGKFFVIGVGLALWGFLGMLIMPLYRVIKFVVTDPAMQRKRRRVMIFSGALTGMIVSAVFFTPLPSFTVAEGVLWAPENSRVYAGADSFVKEIAAMPGEIVKKGTPLIICENPDLAAEVKVLEAQLNEFESRHRLAETRDRTEAKILMDEIERIRAELESKLDDNESLTIRSSSSGVFLLPNSEDLPGCFIRRGVQLGYVVDFSKVTARIVVSQRDIDRVRTETRGVVARLAGKLNEEFTAFIKREVPAASSNLPSLALSLEGGGELALDPREKEEVRAYEKLFHFEIVIEGTKLETIGERVYVRFSHDPEPMAVKFYRGIRRTLLSKFSI